MKRRIERILDLQHSSQLTDVPFLTQTDFSSNTGYDPWAGVAIETGTSTLSIGVLNHSGTRDLKSSTSANSGYAFNIYKTTIFLSGGEQTALVFKTGASLTGTTIRFGFMDSLLAPTVGAYIDIAETTLTGICTKASTPTSTASGLTLAVDTWYSLVVKFTSTSLVTFYVFGEDGTLLWSDTVATNIPTGYVGHYAGAVNSGTTSFILAYVDYMNIIMNSNRVVRV